ncbi:hypothetical protein LOTGIDRAFT_120568 [Lottia gigantea]|uniref:DNA polymerase theta n=1 Tax=Lottia gigantea TaxID=225164 RepID=V4A710_LOTGI|nr:hypothetical protein LOTGIDRAFT_120568 [Lottia gigantea]ESO92507.1 hypothetical protein LOTGIDRAFT_120568 [Lottia gigantea]
MNVYIVDIESRLDLRSWGLPEPVLKHYAKVGVTKMFEWQAECLCTVGVLGGSNLVYSAPTSAGKTMVAELLILKQVLENKRKALFILPFVSVAREKMFSLQKLYQDAGIRVSGFMGSYNPPGGFSNIDVAVCTIEKGNSLINRLLQEDRLKELGTIVIDELHMVGDSGRGYLLELLLTKICYVAKKRKEESKGAENVQEKPVQIIGMSATLPNLPLLAKWLNAELYVTNYRPVPLAECVKVGQTVYDNNLEKKFEVNKDYIVPGDDEHLIPLSLQTVLNCHSVLIFCPTRSWCEKLCETIAREFYNIKRCYLSAPNMSDFLLLPLDYNALNDVREQLQRTPTGLDNILGKTVPYGVAYHHAGLTFEERDIIEGAFRQCQIKVLVATSTLSSGVNLPARRVIIRTPIFHGQVIDTLVYKQMVGRAGRKGVDTEGESILICKESEKKKVLGLLETKLPPVSSCLIKDNELSTSFKRAVLEVVASGVAQSPNDVGEYVACTMLSASLENGPSETTSTLIDSCLDFLQDNEFVTLKKNTEGEDRFIPSQLGIAVLASALSPDEGLVVFADLQKARKCFVLESELHVIFLVTPIYSQEIAGNIDWYQFYGMWENMAPDMRRVAELVGVEESFICRAIRGRILTKTTQQMRAVAIHKRFYTALVLHELVNEKPLNDIIKKYHCNKGQLSSLQQTAATFAGMVTVFCGKLGWHNLELILGQFQNRLTFGVQRELCDLVRITALNAQRARCLYNDGYQTVASLANADPNSVENAFLQSMAFQSNKTQEGESEWEAEKRRQCRCIYLGGRKAVTIMEAAMTVVDEAKTIIQEELGGVGIQWAGPSNALNITSNKVNQSFSFITPTGRARSSKKKAESSSGKKGRKGRRKKNLITSPSSQDDKDVIKKIVLSPPESYIRSRNSSFNTSALSDSSLGAIPASKRESLSISKIQEGMDMIMNDDSFDISVSHVKPDNALIHSKQLIYELNNKPVVNALTPKIQNKIQQKAGNITPIAESAIHFKSTSTPNFLDSVDNAKKFSAPNLDVPQDKPHTRKSKMRKNDNTNSSMSDSSIHNASSESDVVPPTPPDQKSLVMSPCLRKSLRKSHLESPHKAQKERTPVSKRKQSQNSSMIKENHFLRSSAANNGRKPEVTEHDNAYCGGDISLDVSKTTQTQQYFSIIDVCSSYALFQTFIKEWKTKKRFSLCVACEPKPKKSITTGLIGQNFHNHKGSSNIRGEDIDNDDRLVVGLAVSWENRDVYYIALSKSNLTEDPNDTLLAFSLDQNISLQDKLKAVKDVMDNPDSTWVAFDIKSQFSVIVRGCGVVPKTKLEDPKIGNWLFDPDAKEKNLHGLVTNSLPQDVILLESIGGCSGTGSLGLLPHTSITGRFRASTESVLAIKLMDYFKEKLKSENLLGTFQDVEMPSIITLTRMELNGFGFSDEECEHQKKLMSAKLSQLESDAYKLAGHPFSLTSTDDIAQVLYLELHLPVNGDPNAQQIKTLGPNRRSVKRRAKPQYSTAKDVLEKLKTYHALPGVILEWRRISMTLTKQVFPLQRERIYCERVLMNRIFGVCQFHTSTGRVSMREPNIQNIPKDFQIDVPDALVENGRKNSSIKEQVAVSMRHTFTPYKGCVMLAADYSQLELRVIAHLSNDKKLIGILNSNQDVFKQIAGQWLNLTPEQVSTEQRQQAKQICYGMLYGIGPKALGEQIDVDENEAGVFMETFKSKYPGLRKYLQSTVENCKKECYVETITGRKRHLSSIKSTNIHARAQAERQAVNTTVQGSAADIVKIAMNNIDRKLQQLYPDTQYPHSYKYTAGKNDQLPHGAFLLLQLHDELIYEVSENEVDKVSKLVKREMESAIKLSVKLQVKVKTGKTWASLEEG